MIWECVVIIFWFGDVFGDDFVTADSNPMSKTTGNSPKRPSLTTYGVDSQAIVQLTMVAATAASITSLAFFGPSTFAFAWPSLDLRPSTFFGQSLGRL